MQLAEFVESLILGKFECIPDGHVRMNPSVHPEIPRNIGEARQIGFVGKARFYADPGVPEGQARFIDADGKISILAAPEEKPVEAEKPQKKKLRRKRKTRTVHTRPSKADRV